MPLGHPWEWWFTEFLPALEGIGSLATLGLVILYYYLFRETQEQTHALQAAHTPVLDVRHNIGENDLLVSITNRGVGTATNVKLRIKITSDDQIYEYEGKLPSLRPGQTYQEDTDDISSSALRNPFKVAPTFDLGKETVCISELLDHLKKESTDNCWVQVYVEYTDVIEVLDGEEYLMAGFLDPTKEGFHKAFKLPELEAVEQSTFDRIMYRINRHTQRVWESLENLFNRRNGSERSYTLSKESILVDPVDEERWW